MRSGLAASTVTPGNTAPETSFTTPVIDAWANAEAGRTTTRPHTNSSRFNTLISAPFRAGRGVGISNARILEGYPGDSQRLLLPLTAFFTVTGRGIRQI